MPQDPDDSKPSDQVASDRKIEANRENAKKSTGPSSAAGKLAMCRNATKHGLLSKALIFHNQVEEAEFQEILDNLIEDYKPQGVVERVLVEEIAVCLKKIAAAERLAIEDMNSRRDGATAVLDVFMNSSDSAANPFSKQEKRVCDTARGGWECTELVVRVGGKDEPDIMDDSFTFGEKKKSTLQFQARLGNSANTIMRYVNTWKRDLYRAIETLRNLQRARRLGE
jgi:hypothetical protein